MEACNYTVIQQHSNVIGHRESLESKNKVSNNSRDLEHENKDKSPSAIVIRRQSKESKANSASNNNSNNSGGDGAYGHGTKNIRKSLKKYSDRNSVVSNASLDATDNVRTSEVCESSSESNCDVNIEYGSSVFYVVWD